MLILQLSGLGDSCSTHKFKMGGCNKAAPFNHNSPVILGPFLTKKKDSSPMAQILDGEYHVIAATHHLVKALEGTKSLTGEVKKLLADLDSHLSRMMQINEGEAEDNREIEARIVSAQRTITSLHSNHSKIWDCGPAVVLEYLHAIDEVQRSAATLTEMPLKRNSRSKELFDRAQCLLQMAMTRLQNELIYILVQNKQCFEQEYTPVVYEESIVSNEDDSVEESIEEYAMDLIHPDVVPQIKLIATTMSASGYIREFCDTFVSFWRNTLDDYLRLLDFEHFSIEDVLHMEWKFLNSTIKKWRTAIKSIVGIYLVGAKRLFDYVLGEFGNISSISLVEASKGPLICLLNFGQAVSIGPHRPEWLYCLLDMYETLSALVPDIDALFVEDSGSLLRFEFDELLKRLGDSARVIFKELGNHIASCSSKTPFANGGIHPLTKYVMNYILCLEEYGGTLDLVLREEDNEDFDVAGQLQVLTSILEANLIKKSNLYKDCSLKHVFMMNNIHYMVQKIGNSKIVSYFGDEWIKRHVVKFRQHAMSYERVTWGCILGLLRDDGKKGKAILKTRCRAFYSGFEDLYKNQTGWHVPDSRLREDLRISASKSVIPAYRNFVSKIVNSIGEKYIKYTEQDLETYILDLLEGSSKSLNHSKRR